MEIQKYQPITAHILGHAKVEKLPEKQDLSKSTKRTYNVTMPQPILVNIQIESKNKHSKPLSAIKEGTLKCHMNASCQVLSLMPKIPVISVGSKMERSILVHSNWSDLWGRNLPFHFDKPVHYLTSLQ